MTKSTQYKNKHVRSCALQFIEQILKTIRPAKNQVEIKIKLQGLRINFFNEYKKVEASKSSGVGEDAVYHPNLWYYKKHLFLLKHNIIQKTTDTIEENAEPEEDNADNTIADCIEATDTSLNSEEYFDENTNIHYIVTEVYENEVFQNDNVTIANTSATSQSCSRETSISSDVPAKRRKKKVMVLIKYYNKQPVL